MTSSWSGKPIIPGEIPETVYRNTLDLNRFSNSVSKKLVLSYNRVILDAVKKLEAIEKMPRAKQPAYKAARLRSLLRQVKNSLDGWSNKSSDSIIKDLDGIAKLQSEFAMDQLAKALPSGVESVIHPINVSDSFAKSVVNTSPTQLNASLLSDDLKGKVTGRFSLTAKEGALINLPNGKSVRKSFRGLAASQADLFGKTVRDGMLTGETTPQIASRLIGTLSFGQEAKSVKQIALAGGQATKMANHQIQTIVHSAVQQVSNTASQTVYKSNSDITDKYRYVATLDTRTSPICRDLDGQEFEYGKGPEPLQHFRCRSTTVAVLNYEKLGVPPPSKPLGKRAAEGGSVPAGTTYGKWLSQQNQKVKGEALGKSKVKYFNAMSKKYGPDQAIKKFVAKDGSEKTLTQLQKAYGKTPSTSKKLKPTPKVAKAPVKPTPKLVPKAIKPPAIPVKGNPDMFAGPKLATAKDLPQLTKDHLFNYEIVNLKKARHREWFENQKVLYKEMIPKGQKESITPKQLGRRIKDYEIGKIQKKYDKAYAKSLIPKEDRPKRAPLKQWDNPSFLDKKLAGESKTSAVRSTSGEGKKTTDIIWKKPTHNELGLTKSQFKRLEDEIIGEWSGDAFVELRGIQLQQAQAVGAHLNPNQVTHLKRFKNIRARTLNSQSAWARRADAFEDFISKNPKWKGAAEGLGNDLVEAGYGKAPKGTIFRGMALNNPKVIDEIITAYQRGDASLTLESWTASITKAGNFALGEISPGPHQVLISQVNKYGTSIEPWNGQGEREIVQPRGVRYKLISHVTKKIKGGSRTEIKLEAY